jgi:hypothetical protein
MKAMKFKPGTPLESAIHAGDAEATLGVLRAESEEGRTRHRASLLRLQKLMEDARWDKAKSDWGTLTDEQNRCHDIALVLCGTAKDVGESWVSAELIEELCKEFRPRALDGLADAMLAHTPNQIRSVQHLIATGLVPRPDTDNYVLGLISLPHVTRDTKKLQALFDADPGLRPSLLRVFDIEGNADISLTSSDKYYRNPAWAWPTLLLSMVADGITTREVLLDRTLGALEKDWPQYRSGWFSRFHAELDPDAAAMRLHLPRYLALCASRIPPTVAFALDALKKLDADKPIDGQALLRALRPVMASPVKGQLDAAMKLVDRVVKRDPSLAAEASATIVMGLLHEAAPVQASVLQRLENWGIDAAARTQLADFMATVAATNRPRLQKLIGAAAPVEPAAAPAAPAMAPTPTHPLDADRQLAPFADQHELVECIAHVFENADDVDAFERAAAELVRVAPIADEDKPLFAPVRKRAAKMAKLLPRELARLLLFVLDGTRVPGHIVQDFSGNLAPLEGLLNGWIDDLMDVAAQGRHQPPLSAPTHRGGFIDPQNFVARVEAHRLAGVDSSESEQVRGLLRLTPGCAPELRARAGALPDDAFTRALRYALGNDIAPGAEHDLFAAAARIRHPRADDTVLDKRHPGLGPDAAQLARYSWRVHYTENRDSHDLLVESSLRSDDVPRTRPAVMRHPGVNRGRRYYHYQWWSFAGPDEGAIRLSATVLPSDPEAFMAEGAHLVGANLDWEGAQWQNRAYLELLLDPVSRMTPMANLLLLLGLCGKEPGQTAIAVDALVRSHGEGRLDKEELARTLRALMATPLPKAARLHKSLQAALRADPQLHGLVFELLCAAVQARPSDPPKDTALLLDLLVELKLGGPHALPPEVRAALVEMKLGGRAASVRRSLLD